MSTWNNSYEENEQKWRNIKHQISSVKNQLLTYFYDPFESDSNDTYGKETWGDWEQNHEYGIFHKLFLLPTPFGTHSLDKLLTPLQPPILPVLPELPPLKPLNSPGWYKTRVHLESLVDRFDDVEWVEIAKENLSKQDFEKKILSWEKLQLINNLLVVKKYNETQLLVDERRLADEIKFDRANTNIQEFKFKIENGASVECICRLIEIAHKRHYLPKFLRNSYEVAIDTESKTLLIQFEFPDYSNVSISFGDRKNGGKKYLSQPNKKKHVRECLYSLMIRSGFLGSKFNIQNYFQNVVINVEQKWFDPATGQPRTGIIASLQGASEYFEQLDLSKLNPDACFKQLKGLATPSIENISPIRPIISLNKEDKRFVKNRPIEDDLIPENNLALMEWVDFEHLVAQLFEWEFRREGVEVKVTRASRDRGVDAILFDPDPLRGGKYVLQAKRYTRTVDVSAVRDLYGTVMNEGANRGILITTASYGPDSYEFAKDKPISLVDGPNLLAMLKRHGKVFRIDLDEAKANNSLSQSSQ